jgi:hypothetical protein
MIKWSMPRINPPITVIRRNELREIGDEMAIVDIITVPFSVQL